MLVSSCEKPLASRPVSKREDHRFSSVPD